MQSANRLQYPAVYGPARDLFMSVLRGRLDFQSALAQVRWVPDETERKCARDVLEASKYFLTQERPAEVEPLSRMGIDLPNGMDLRVAPVWVRHLSPPCLLVLHFWQVPLSTWQLSATAAILMSAMQRDKPTCLDLDLDFISVAVPDHSAKRRLRLYNWDTLKRLDDDELRRFLQRLCDAWAEYQKRGPRAYKPRPHPDLFDS